MRRREWETGVCAAVDEERRQVVAERRGGTVDCKFGEREMTVPVVLAAVGVGAISVSLMAPPARSAFASVFLRWAEPTRRHEPMLLTKARNRSRVKSASWSSRGRPRAHLGNRRRSGGACRE